MPDPHATGSRAASPIDFAAESAKTHAHLKSKLDATPDRAATVEWCRECRDERPMGAPGVPAEFILWGKLLPPDALGPRCYDHAAAHLGHAAMSRIDQYAVFDLRTVRRAS